jgi:CRP-like cAMP-binding protein
MVFLKQRPEAMLRIVGLLCTRMRRVTRLVEESLFLDVSARLARLIVALTDAGRPKGDPATPLRLSQNDLARMLGVSREFVSKQLTLWRDGKIIEVGRRRLTIRDRKALERLCNGERGDLRRPRDLSKNDQEV